MAYLDNDVLKLSQQELDEFIGALIQTEEIDHGENVGEVYDEWRTKFARQAFEAAGREFTWEFEFDEAVLKITFDTINEHFGPVHVVKDMGPMRDS